MHALNLLLERKGGTSRAVLAGYVVASSLQLPLHGMVSFFFAAELNFFI